MEKTENVKRLMKEFKKKKTTNQAIQNLFEKDVRSDKEHVLSRGWKYYVHLNKLISPMSANGMISHVETITGPTGRPEKVWVSNER